MKKKFGVHAIDKVAEWIVNMRALMVFLFALAVIFSVTSVGKVKINYDFTSYLPDSTETKQSIDIMAEEFTEFGTAKIMISNVTKTQAWSAYEALCDLELVGVKDITYEEDHDHYSNASALFEITFEGEDGSDEAWAAAQGMRAYLEESGYDVSVVATQSKADYAAELSATVTRILVVSVIVIILVLLFTSKSYMEIPVFIIVFAVALLLNMGTNFFFVEISFITNSICMVLQLALSIDYAIIFSHRFMEEMDVCGTVKQAVISALSKAISEISSSSLTTICGLAAMCLMQLTLGLDMGRVLIKAVLCSMVTVFLLMPALLMIFGKLIVKMRHKSFVPNISGFAKWVVNTKTLVPIFLVLFLVCGYLQAQNSYVYSPDSITTDKVIQTRVEKAEIEAVFGKSNVLAILVPTGDYARERAVLEMVESYPLVDSALGLANITIDDEERYYLTDKLTYKEFSDALDISVSSVKALYLAYGLDASAYGVLNLDEYRISIIDMVDFIHKMLDEGAVTLDDETQQDFDDLYDELSDGRLQLEGENYSRLVFNVTADVESPEAYELVETIRADIKQYYDGALLVGNSTSNYDLNATFTSDNIKISVLTALFVLVVLLFTFQSVATSVLLVFAIQGSIFINFAIPVITGNTLFFFSYLIVSSIQMGATIDYAIVFTSRYRTLRKTMDAKEASARALNEAFPTILTSGTIMTVCGFLVGLMSSDPCIFSIGFALGQGTLISILIVLLVLPKFVVLFDKWLEKTSFARLKVYYETLQQRNESVLGADTKKEEEHHETEE